jgi:hypothetical protein
MAHSSLSREALVLALIATAGCSSKPREFDEGAAGSNGIAGNQANKGGQSQGGSTSSAGRSSNAAGASAIAGNQSSGGTTAAAGATSTGGAASSLAGATSTGGIGTAAGATSTGGIGTAAGATSTGGVTTAGGSAPTGGARTNGGTTSSSGGNVSGGTVSTTGGRPATGGTTATGGCAVAADCKNPDPYTCTATCASGTCKLAVTSPLAPAGVTYSATTAPTDGFWDATNAPYVTYAPYADSLNPPSVVIQKVKADGTNNGGGVSLMIPTDLAQPTELAAAMSGTQLGLLFGAIQTTSTAYPNATTQFVRTDVNASAASPVAVSVSTYNGPSHEDPYTLFVAPSGTANWTLAHMAGNNVTHWAGYSGPVTTATTFTGLSSSPLSGYGAMVVLDDTVLVSGLSCSNYGNGHCTAPDLLITRYLVSDLSAVGTATTIASVPYVTDGAATPAMAKVGTKLALLWTDQATTGELQMGTAILYKDGTFAQAAAKATSNLIPKAIVEAPNGSVLLVANRQDTASSFTPVVQTLSATLQPVGSPYPIGGASSTDTMRDVSAKNSTDGRTLITFRIDGVPYRRILHSNLCQ